MFKLLRSSKSTEGEVKECPYPFESDDCTKYLNSTYNNSINETILLKESLYEDLCYLCEIGNEISKLNKEKKKIENIIKNEMKEYENAYCKEINATWKKTTKVIIDTKRLREDHPELAREYSKITTSRVFRIK